MSENPSNKEILSKLNLINQNLELLNSLITIQIIGDINTTTDRVWKLHQFGFSNKDIAKLLNITPNIVSARISEKKK